MRGTCLTMNPGNHWSWRATTPPALTTWGHLSLGHGRNKQALQLRIPRLIQEHLRPFLQFLCSVPPSQAQRGSLRRQNGNLNRGRLRHCGDGARGDSPCPRQDPRRKTLPRRSSELRQEIASPLLWGCSATASCTSGSLGDASTLNKESHRSCCVCDYCKSTGVLTANPDPSPFCRPRRRNSDSVWLSHSTLPCDCGWYDRPLIFRAKRTHSHDRMEVFSSPSATEIWDRWPLLSCAPKCFRQRGLTTARFAVYVLFEQKLNCGCGTNNRVIPDTRLWTVSERRLSTSCDCLSISMSSSFDKHFRWATLTSLDL